MPTARQERVLTSEAEDDVGQCAGFSQQHLPEHSFPMGQGRSRGDNVTAVILPPRVVPEVAQLVCCPLPFLP